MSLLAVGCLAALALAVWPSQSQAAPKEKLPEGAKIVSLEVQPPADRAGEQVRLRAGAGHGQAGQRRPGRRDARWSSRPCRSDLAEVSPTGVVRPKADGDGQITFAVGGQSHRRAGEGHRGRRPTTPSASSAT